MGLVHNHPHRWPAPLQPLEHTGFRSLWCATLISNAGSWMQRVATAWLVYSITRSTAWLGLESFAAGIPAVLLLPIGGVLADRLNRRFILIAANLLNSLLAGLLALAWWAGWLTVPFIVALSFLSGLVSSFMVPASQSVLPSVAGEDHLPGAIALNSVQYNLARALGPALGGTVLAAAGPGWCFLLNALSFLALVAAFLFIRTIPTPAAPRQSLLAGLREGARLLRHRPDLQRILLLIALLAFSGSPLISMLPALSKEILRRNAAGYSLLLTAFGIGAALAGLLLVFSPPLKRRLAVVYPALLLVAGVLIAVAWITSLPASALLVALAGGAFVGAMIELGTSLLQNTPDPFRGRVTSIQQLLFRAAHPLGALLAGLLAARLRLPLTFTLFGLLLALATLTLWHRSPPTRIKPPIPPPE